MVESHRGTAESAIHMDAGHTALNCTDAQEPLQLLLLSLGQRYAPIRDPLPLRTQSMAVTPRRLLKFVDRSHQPISPSARAPSTSKWGYVSELTHTIRRPVICQFSRTPLSITP
jgi:hypothetical protein